MDLIAFFVGGAFVACMIVFPKFRYGVGGVVELAMKLGMWVLIVSVLLLVAMASGNQ
jgi:hypothetical protein